MNRSRHYRKISDFALMLLDLDAAVAAGASRQDSSTEARMADAQRGNLASLEPELGKLFASYKDPDEVCEAFVLGYLLKYRLQDALQLLSVWEKDYPNDDRVHFLRGRIVEHRPDFDAALVEYKKAVSLNPLNAAAAYNAGRVLLTKKSTQQALVYYLQCAETLGDPRPGWIAAAGCCRVLGQLKKAHEYLTKAEAFSGGGSYLSQSEAVIHFGIPEAASISHLTVKWPGGSAQSLRPSDLAGDFNDSRLTILIEPNDLEKAGRTDICPR